ncbi:MAG: GMC family oxidoreductase [Deltaproteobacteria bacterium]|nr:GMC family oxidoreductase [Deltaproteobacteria bacterium]
MAESPASTPTPLPTPTPPAAPAAAPARPRLTGALSRREREIAAAVAETAIPVGRRFGLSVTESGLIDELDVFLSSGRRRFALGYRMLLWVFELSTLWPWVGMRPFSRLSPRRRKEALQAWHDSPYFLPRAMLRGLTTLLFILFYGHPRVNEALRFRLPAAPPAAPRTPPANARNLRPADGDLALEADVVVVGSGAGGAAAAWEMARRGMAVVVLEDGPFVARGEFTGHALDMTRLMYRDDGVTIALGKPGILLPIGRVAGGTTTINSGTCFRTPPEVLAAWRYSRGLNGLTDAVLAPHFDQVERVLGVEPTPDHLLGRCGHIVARGASRMGLRPFPLPRNAPGCEGSGVCCFGCPTRAKRSANESWLPMAMERGARLLCNVAAQRIVWDGKRAAGVVGRVHGGGTVTVKAPRVVVAAGTLHTPALLRASGVRSPALGRFMTIHPATKCLALMDEPVRGWEGVPQGLGVDADGLDGIKFEGAFVPPSVGAVAIPLVGEEHVEVMEQYDRLATYGFMVKDQPNGWLAFRGLDTVPFYTPGEHELVRLRRGVSMLVEIFLAAGARTVLTPIAGFPRVANQAELADLRRYEFDVGEVELSAFHPLGTARMAEDPEQGVCDENGAVHGRQGVYIADGAAVPSSLGVNPQVTIMALALRLGARLAGNA